MLSPKVYKPLSFSVKGLSVLPPDRWWGLAQASVYVLFDVYSLGNDSDVDLDRREDERARAPKRPCPSKAEKSLFAKEAELGSGAKNPIITVVLTAHEAIPGKLSTFVVSMQSHIWGAVFGDF